MCAEWERDMFLNCIASSCKLYLLEIIKIYYDSIKSGKSDKTRQSLRVLVYLLLHIIQKYDGTLSLVDRSLTSCDVV